MTTPQPQGWEERLDEILYGIDKDESIEGGWWETSVGVEFGKKKKAEITTLIAEQKRELVKEMVEVVKEANNLRQAKIDGKEDWNRAMEQCAAKFDAVISTLTAIAEKHNVQL